MFADDIVICNVADGSVQWNGEEWRLTAAKQNTNVQMRRTHVEWWGYRDEKGGGL